MARFDPSYILAGTDFSGSSAGAVREALRLAAGDPGRRVSVVNVAREVVDAGALRTQIDVWTQSLPEFSSLHDPRQFTPEIEVGRVVDGLSRCVQRLGATHLVVGPRPRGFLERWFTGGVAEQLFHNVTVPVLATRGPCGGGYRRILVPIAIDDMAREAVEMALGVATDPSSDSPTVEILHVGRSPHGGADLDEFRSSLRANLEEDLRAFVSSLDLQIPNLSVRVELGAVQQVVPEVAASTGTDLVCMASRRAGSFLGSTVDAVLRSLQVPMMVAHVPD